MADMSNATGEIFAAHVRLLNRYCHALDSCDWPLFTDLFAEEVVFAARVMQGRVPGPDDIRLEGRAALVGHISKTWRNLAATHHMISNHVVDPASDGGSATGSCYIRAYHAGAGERAHLFEESLGRFDFETVRIGSAWKIRRWDETIMIMLGTPEVFGHPPGGPAA